MFEVFLTNLGSFFHQCTNMHIIKQMCATCKFDTIFHFSEALDLFNVPVGPSGLEGGVDDN